MKKPEAIRVGYIIAVLLCLTVNIRSEISKSYLAVVEIKSQDNGYTHYSRPVKEGLSSIVGSVAPTFYFRTTARNTTSPGRPVIPASMDRNVTFAYIFTPEKLRQIPQLENSDSATGLKVALTHLIASILGEKYKVAVEVRDTAENVLVIDFTPSVFAFLPRKTLNAEGVKLDTPVFSKESWCFRIIYLDGSEAWMRLGDHIDAHKTGDIAIIWSAMLGGDL